MKDVAQGVFTHSELGSKSLREGSYIQDELSTISGESCAKVVLSIQHEGINPKGEATLPPIFKEGSPDDLF